MGRGRIVLELPQWLDERIREPGRELDSVEARMRFVIALARANVEQGTGGPFAAAVFEAAGGRVGAQRRSAPRGAGVNLVEPSNCSIAHAEIIALALAQQAVGHYDLGATASVYELVTSAEPCAMCLGAVPWSGVRRLVCAARGADAGAIGFDEGAKPADWVGEFRRRGIEVVQDVLREEAQAVLRHYADTGGRIYNARQGRRTQ